MSKIHQWFVVRGRLGISSEGNAILLELDPEGSAYCVLSAQDANEIAGIVANEARSVWDASERAFDRVAQVEGDASASCKLATESGVLQAMVHDSKPLVALAFDAGAVCRMDVAQAIALVQILQQMAKTVESRRS